MDLSLNKDVILCVFRRILIIFPEQLFYRTPANECFRGNIFKTNKLPLTSKTKTYPDNLHLFKIAIGTLEKEIKYVQS